MKKLKAVLLQIGSALLVVSLFSGIYIFSYKTGGTLTTAASCTGEYIKGEYDIKTLKRQCPNISKQHLIETVNNYFDGDLKFPAFGTREELLSDIDTNF